MKAMKLELFHLNACPYCAKVREYLEQSGLKKHVAYHEVEEENGALARLESLNRGSHQVPCLVVDGRPLLESTAIIEFCEENFDRIAEARPA
jgi:glutaredoxin